jgi:hypothetical protein
MIAYYPLEDDPPPKKEVPLPPPIPKGLFSGETTECNYVVMAFVVGVLFIALSDSMRR